MQKALEELPPGTFDGATAPMQVVGQFLDVLLKDHVFPQKVSVIESQILPHHLQNVSDRYSRPLYYSPTDSQMNFICLVLKVLSGVPEAYQIMRCQARTTSEELNLFLKRVETHHMNYLMLGINELSFELQEVGTGNNAIASGFSSTTQINLY